MRKTDDRIILEMLKAGRQQKEIAEHFGVSPAAICKRVKRICLPESLNKLTIKEREFAVRVAQGASKTNATLEAFDAGSPDSARALGNKLIKKPSVNAAITDLLIFHGLDRCYRIGRLRQHVDNADPGVSLKALDQSWRLDGGFIEERPPQTINIEQLVIKGRALEEERRKLEKLLGWLDDEIPDAEITDAEFEMLDAIHETS